MREIWQKTLLLGDSQLGRQAFRYRWSLWCIIEPQRSGDRYTHGQGVACTGYEWTMNDTAMNDTAMNDSGGDR